MNNADRLKYQRLFGTEPESISERLIISPFFDPKSFKPRLKEHKFFQGIAFKGISGIYKNKSMTFINTGMGHTLVGDCVLAQDVKEISQIIFLGAVGAVDNFKIGECVMIKQAAFDENYYYRLGFSILKKSAVQFFAADELLKYECLSVLKQQNKQMREIKIMSLNSLWEQDENLAQRLKQEGVEAVDLECAIFYAVAAKKNIKAIALCFVSDHIQERPYWSDFSYVEKMQLKKSMSELADLALEISIKD